MEKIVTEHALTGLVEGRAAPPLLDVDHDVDDGHEGEGGGRRGEHVGERPEVLVDGDGAVVERGAAEGEAEEARHGRPRHEPLEAVAVPAVCQHDHAGLHARMKGG